MTAIDAAAEAERLAELARLDLTRFELDEELTVLVREAAARLDVPMGLATVLLADSQYLLAFTGVTGWIAEVRGTPREWSYCRHVVEQQGPFVAEDAQQHEALRDTPLPWNEGLRSYAGVPLRSARGTVLGSFCVLGTEPRKFTQEELDVLVELSERATAVLERHPA